MTANKSRLSASGIKTYMSCNASAQCVEERHNVYRDSSDHGIVVHKYIELIYSGYSQHGALMQISPAARPFCRAIDISELPGVDSARAEVSFEYEIATQKAMEVALVAPREYEWREGCVYGTADIVSPTHEVWDIKTGNAPVDRPSVNTQLLFFAMCLSRMYKPLAVYRVGIVFVHDDGSIQKVSGNVSHKTVERFESLLCMSYPPSIVSETINDNCSFCNRRFVCQTLQASLSAFDVSTKTNSVSQQNAKILSRVMSDYSKIARVMVVEHGNTSLVREYEVVAWSDALREASQAGELASSMIDEVPGVVPVKALPPELVVRLREKGLIKSRRSLKSVAGKGA